MKKTPFAYEIVMENILKRIADGDLREGDRLPALDVLEKTYPQSRVTLYKALRLLTERGYLTMSRGRGTFVKTTHVRSRIAILTGERVFDLGVTPFAVQVYRFAQSYFARCGMDTQLYTEDRFSPTGLPMGLHDELSKRKIAGLMTVSAGLPFTDVINSAEWRSWGIPHVNIGSGPARHNIDVDREAFLNQALSIVRKRGCKSVALAEQEEHRLDHVAFFQARCAELGLKLCPAPASMPSKTLSYEQYGYELFSRIWANKPRPDAVIIPDDIIAKGVSQAALGLGLRNPADVLLVAMTNRGSGFFYPVPIIALEVNIESFAAIAGRMLIDLINKKTVSSKLLLLPPAVGERMTEPVPPIVPDTHARSAV